MYFSDSLLKGGSNMSAKLSVALDYLAKAGEICIIIAEAGKRVVALYQS